MYNELINKANILIEALPYIQTLKNKTVVIKYGGSIMENDTQIDTILQDVTLLKYVGANPIVIHGGGPGINSMLAKLKVEPHFENGLRVTDAATMEVVEMVLTGTINKSIVAKLNMMGGKAIGLCGKDGSLIEVEKMPPKNGIDYGFVGQIKKVNVDMLNMLCSQGYIPIISPTGVGSDGNSYNINADTVAGEIAAALGAEKLMFLTDVDGVRMDQHDPDSLVPVISVDNIYRLIDQKIISGGMIPKVMGCIKAIEQGVNRTHIVNGMIPHPIVLEIFTDKGIGTMVTR